MVLGVLPVVRVCAAAGYSGVCGVGRAASLGIKEREGPKTKLSHVSSAGLGSGSSVSIVFNLLS